MFNRFLKLFFLFILLLNLTDSKGQEYASESIHDLNIREIILNCRDNKVKDFIIIQENMVDSLKVGKTKKYYLSIENDSILIQKYNRFKNLKRNQSRYGIRNNEFIFLKKEENNSYKSACGNFLTYKIVNDSSNLNYKITYRIINDDTILRIVKDSLNRELENIWFNKVNYQNATNKNYYTNEEGHKYIKRYNGDTIFSKSYFLINNRWILNFDDTLINLFTIKRVNPSFLEKTEISYSMGVYYNSNSLKNNLELPISFKSTYKTIKTYSFDNNLIKTFEIKYNSIDYTNNFKTEEKEILTLEILKK